MTLFLLLAAMILAGTGAAAPIERVLLRLRWNVLVLNSVRTGIVLLVLGGFTWWATRPGVAERFAQETGFSPAAKALVAGVLLDVRPGDYVVAPFPTIQPVRFYLAAAEHRLTQIDGDSFLPVYKKTRMYQIKGARPNMSGRIFLFFDKLTYNALFTSRGRLARSPAPDDQAIRRYLEENDYNYQIVVNLPDGKVYRLTGPVSLSATTFPSAESATLLR